ncbi:hypothetical protein BJ138DRAFT_1198552 [Hygrophoropsis aurantiaca]|uniref:Uncharacterized protein n=1 Tax=Hygrophoropsis aurantiaca TaxID=72124 RepID=A0ACB7ZQD0_9AGAM|nr:hypothetical protein BJ138DRAFT_1198552 [Hygrophoropsis aurantiaca]
MTSPRRTRSQNANKHPGKVQLDADAAAHEEQNTGKRRTKKAAAVEGPKEMPAQKAARIRQAVQQVAEAEANMEVRENQASGARPKPVRPKPRPVGKGKQKQIVEDEELMEDGENDVDVAVEKAPSDPQPSHKGKVTEKPSKNLMREAVKNARENMDAAIALTSMRGSCLTLDHDHDQSIDARVVNEKGNTGLATAKKFAVAAQAAQMMDWINNVHVSKPDSVPTSQGSRTSTSLSQKLPPPSIISTYSQSSKATTASTNVSKTSHGHSKNPDVPSDILVGGFSDEDLDDSKEREAAVVSVTRKGKRKIKVIEIVEDSQSDSEQEELDIPISRSVVQTPRVVSTSAKRKIEETSIPETEGEDSDIEIADGGYLMDVDIPEAKVEAPPTVKAERESRRTTSSTSVTTVVKSALPLPKRVKTEQDDGAGELSGSQATENTTSTVRRVPRTKFRNSDLPISTSDPRWLQDYMNTVILWAGSQRGWELPKLSLVKAIQKIFDFVFPEIDYEAKPSSLNYFKDDTALI